MYSGHESAASALSSSIACGSDIRSPPDIKTYNQLNQIINLFGKYSVHRNILKRNNKEDLYIEEHKWG